MGADLYNLKLREGNNQYTGFVRDLSVGYWRDAYNNSNLLWQFDMSYWNDLPKYLDDKGDLQPVKAVKLLNDLKKREKRFEKNLDDLLVKRNKYWDYTTPFNGKRRKYEPDMSLTNADRLKWVMEYRASYKGFKKFLQTAIEMNAVIECSI